MRIWKHLLIACVALALASPAAAQKKYDTGASDTEIRVFWSGCDKLGWPFGPMFKLLLLTAQRRDEIGGMEWSEIEPQDNRVWTIPREKADLVWNVTSSAKKPLALCLTV